MRSRAFTALGILSLVCGALHAAPMARVTIIIDDLGYALSAGRRAIALPGPVVCAILPHTPRGRRLAELAHEQGKDVLLHLPLESTGAREDDEPGTITLDMSRSQFSSAVAEGLAEVPFAVGINGHRGSLLTRHPGHMAWLMEEIADRGLLFVDSYTTHRSVALDMAREAGIPATRRHVFLDADPAPEAIAAEFERLKTMARRRGSAVGIGHPYASTLEFLEANLGLLEQEGIALVGIRELLGDYVKQEAVTPTH